MPILLLEGGEKAGKTTLAKFLEREYGARYCHHGFGGPDDDQVYAQRLAADLAAGGLVVWDRAWPSMAVYDSYLGLTSRRLVADPWLGEWLYGRAISRSGAAYYLMGPGHVRREQLRTPDDSAIPFALEEQMYLAYADRFHYGEVVWNGHTAHELRDLAEDAYAAVYSVADMAGDDRVPNFAGPPDAPVLVIGKRPDKSIVMTRGGWLPFSTEPEIRFARAIGDAALACAWTYVDQDPVEATKHADLIIACGLEATAWAYQNRYRHSLAFDLQILSVPEPHWLYLNDMDERLRVELVVKTAINEVFRQHEY